MHRLKAQLGLLAGVALLALPSTAPAQRVVPPGNSAATQYTETFPTAKGPAATKQRSKKAKRSPREALGSTNARRLQSEGEAGRELAAVVAATAPPAAKSNQAPDRKPGSVSSGVALENSSALGEIIDQAGGSSDSGGMGIALPLLLLAAVVGFAVYAWRRRRLAA